MDLRRRPCLCAAVRNPHAHEEPSETGVQYALRHHLQRRWPRSERSPNDRHSSDGHLRPIQPSAAQTSRCFQLLLGSGFCGAKQHLRAPLKIPQRDSTYTNILKPKRLQATFSSKQTESAMPFRQRKEATDHSQTSGSPGGFLLGIGDIWVFWKCWCCSTKHRRRTAETSGSPGGFLPQGPHITVRAE
jgi:hypothetical protein